MPSIDLELSLFEQNYQLIAGLDEAGRGALAGPVTAGAVVLPLNQPDKLEQLNEVNDSKQLTAAQREVFFELIIEHVEAYGIGSASAVEIDTHGIVPATRLAMRRALAQLTPSPHYLLIDGRIRLATVNLPQQSIIRGDSKSLSIAAASILAKVSRDQTMITLARTYPAFGFDGHKGYGTAAHRAVIMEKGPSDVHRLTFAPMKQQLPMTNDR